MYGAANSSPRRQRNRMAAAKCCSDRARSNCTYFIVELHLGLKKVMAELHLGKNQVVVELHLGSKKYFNTIIMYLYRS